MVKDIAKALCELKKNDDKKFDTKEFIDRFVLKPHQKIRIEELL